MEKPFIGIANLTPICTLATLTSTAWRGGDVAVREAGGVPVFNTIVDDGIAMGHLACATSSRELIADRVRRWSRRTASTP